MTDYSELVEALRCELHYTSCPVSDCKYICHDTFCDTYRLMIDAADAIEALQAEVKRLELDNEDYEHENRRLHGEIEAWQAEVKRLKDSNEELRERQTYIDHYGDRWMTSAKDVPTAAYEHGYMDGRDEAMVKMEVQDG